MRVWFRSELDSNSSFRPRHRIETPLIVSELLPPESEYPELRDAHLAEYEQAVYIHWASDLLDKHGDNWLKEGNKIMQGIAHKLTDDRAKQDA